MKVLVTGVTGQLGYDVAKELERRHIEYKGVGSKDMNLSDPAEVEKVVADFHPDVIIHCAAYTAVDKAEDEYGAAMDVNAKGTLALAKVAKAIDAKLLYISTDYVFDGKRYGTICGRCAQRPSQRVWPDQTLWRRSCTDGAGEIFHRPHFLGLRQKWK